MKNAINILLVIAVIIPIALLLYPFAMWNDAMLLILRIIPSFAVQLLFCRVGKFKVIKAIPFLLTGVLAIWGTYLYFTSPHWVNATFWGSLIADYVSPFICCSIALCISLLEKKESNIPEVFCS